jgi:hypothetical protein
LKRGNPLYLNKLRVIPLKDDLCQVWLKLAQRFWRRFLNDPNPFLYFCDYLPFEKDLSLYLNKVELLHPRIICTMFDQILPAGSGEEDF